MLPSNFVVLGLGSNKSYLEVWCVELLKRACNRLSSMFTDFKMSSVYRTKPMYVEVQSDFYNMVVCGFLRDNVSPTELLEKIHAIEADFGRYRPAEIRNGPRSLDIDIEIFGMEKLNQPDLVIPHPRISERAFVLCPLLDVLSENFDDNIKNCCFDFIGVDANKINNNGVEKIINSLDFTKEVNLMN